MPSALKKPTLDELYRRLRDLDYTQVNERMAVMLNAILQLEDEGECRESATEAVLMVGYTTEGCVRSSTDQMAVLERGWSDKGVRFGEEPWSKQQHRVWRGGIPTAGQTISQAREPEYE